MWRSVVLGAPVCELLLQDTYTKLLILSLVSQINIVAGVRNQLIMVRIGPPMAVVVVLPGGQLIVPSWSRSRTPRHRDGVRRERSLLFQLVDRVKKQRWLLVGTLFAALVDAGGRLTAWW